MLKLFSNLPSICTLVRLISWKSKAMVVNHKYIEKKRNFESLITEKKHLIIEILHKIWELTVLNLLLTSLNESSLEFVVDLYFLFSIAYSLFFISQILAVTAFSSIPRIFNQRNTFDYYLKKLNLLWHNKNLLNYFKFVLTV